MSPMPAAIQDAVVHAAALPGRLLPYAVQAPLLQAALNHAFRVPLEEGELGFLEGRRIRVRIVDAGLEWLIENSSTGLRVVGRDASEDVAISGELLDFARLATRTSDPDTLFFQRRIRIEGDTELGLGVKNTMDAMDWDDLPPVLRALLQRVGRVLAGLPAARAA